MRGKQCTGIERKVDDGRIAEKDSSKDRIVELENAPPQRKEPPY
jgi:hypothetical protein